MTVSLDQVPWPVHTERLLLRRLIAADPDTTYAYRSLPEVAEWLTALPVDLTAHRERFATEEVRETTVILEREGQVVGDVLIRVQDGWSQKEVEERARGVEAEIGWVIAPEHQGQGFATEAAGAALRICFEHLGVRRVTAGCFVDNEQSWRIMEKLGMRREQHSLRDGLHRTRGWLDGYQYAILADDWTAESG